MRLRFHHPDSGGNYPGIIGCILRSLRVFRWKGPANRLAKVGHVDAQEKVRKQHQTLLGPAEVDEKAPMDPAPQLVVGGRQLDKPLDEEASVFGMAQPHRLPGFMGFPEPGLVE